LVPEAYANFGYLGVVALAVFLAMFYSFFTNISVGVPMTSLRFVLGLLIMAAATKADTMGVFITTQFQGIAGVSLAAMVLMRRQANPFAVEAANGGLQDYGTAGGRRSETGDRRQVAQQPTDTGQAADGEMQLAADGGVVRTLPIRTPKRIASWMPRRIRAAVVAQYAAEEASEETERPKDGSEKPRQLAVPYQNYRRYRG
jgi:hypothetical protein